jgi:hypothetical protein
MALYGNVWQLFSSDMIFLSCPSIEGGKPWANHSDLPIVANPKKVEK